MYISTYMYGNPFLGANMIACYSSRLNGMHVEYFPWYSIFHSSHYFIDMYLTRMGTELKTVGS